MTLDRGFFTHTIKGHFCSLLVSNIFCDPRFLLSTFYCTFAHAQTKFQKILKGE